MHWLDARHALHRDADGIVPALVDALGANAVLETLDLSGIGFARPSVQQLRALVAQRHAAGEPPLALVVEA